MRTVRVRVPASTANLGSGFDALGMALGLYDVVEVREAEHGLVVEVAGEGAGSVPTDERHLVVMGLRAACRMLGHTPGGLIVHCRNAIPHSRGLGSSAAAVVAGIAAGYALADKELDERALQLAAEFEGHADNAAASMYGGFVLTWNDNNTRYRSIRMDPHPTLSAIALVSELKSSTATTRALLPDRVPHADAAFAVGRCALAVHAVTTRPDLLLAATEDRLHQNYRKSAWPATIRMVNELRGAGAAAVVSGAGPTVLVLTSADRTPPASVDVTGFEVRALEIDRNGVQVRLIG